MKFYFKFHFCSLSVFSLYWLNLINYEIFFAVGQNLFSPNVLYDSASCAASRAQQVPAVSQSAYSPSSSDTGDSMLANSPQTVLTKSLLPANIMGLPPTQPTTKVWKITTFRIISKNNT